jgi:hypothetical protein
MSRRREPPPPKQPPPPAPTKSGLTPVVTEFQNACRFFSYHDEDSIAEWSAFFSSCDRELRLVNKSFTSQFGTILLRFFQRFPKFPRISFYSCYFEDLAFYAKFATDMPKYSISQLMFDFPPMPRDSISPFLLAPNLEFLSLRGAQCITHYDYATGAARLFTDSTSLFYRNLAATTLKAIDLSGCHIGDDGACALASALFFTSSLRCLNLTRNRIGDPGASALAASLSHYNLTNQESEIHDHLVYEDSKQKILDDGTGLLKRKKGGKPKKTTAKAKKGQPQKTINARAASFDPNSPVGPAVLAKWHTVVVMEDGTKVLPGNTTVTTLLLDDNVVTGLGLMVLSEMLKNNQKIVNFSILGNPDIALEEAMAVARKYYPPPPLTPV